MGSQLSLPRKTMIEEIAPARGWQWPIDEVDSLVWHSVSNSARRTAGPASCLPIEHKLPCALMIQRGLIPRHLKYRKLVGIGDDCEEVEGKVGEPAHPPSSRSLFSAQSLRTHVPI